MLCSTQLYMQVASSPGPFPTFQWHAKAHATLKNWNGPVEEANYKHQREWLATNEPILHSWMLVQ